MRFMEIWKVLIVEDDSIILEDMLSIIDWRAEGFQVISAANGKQGIQKAKSELPAIVISDIEMPFVDGLTMIEEISRENPYVKYCIISAHSDFLYARSALRLGAKDYMLKTDISAEQLRENLNDMRNEIRDVLKGLFKEVTDGLDKLLVGSEDADISARLDEILLPCKYFDNSLLLDSASRWFLSRTNRRESDKLIEKPLPSCPEELRRNILLWLSKRGKTRVIKANDRLSAIIANGIGYINDHYHNPNLRIDEIASAVGLSNSRFSVKFKEEVGQTVNDFITDVRIERAKRLLSEDGNKVYEVAEKVGYRNSTYFSQVFFEKTGHKPHGYSERSED